MSPQTFVNDLRIPDQTYITLKLSDVIRFGYDILPQTQTGTHARGGLTHSLKDFSKTKSADNEQKSSFLVYETVCSGQCCAQLHRNDAQAIPMSFVLSLWSLWDGLFVSWLFAHSHIYILERSQHKVPEEALKVHLRKSLYSCTFIGNMNILILYKAL